MRFVRKIFRLGIKALSDVAIGIIIVHLISKAFGYDIIPIYFYPIGVFLSVLPDIDYPYHRWKVKKGKRKYYQAHHLTPHYPLVMIIPICFVLGVLFIFWPVFLYWTVVAVLCLLSHYVNDSIVSKVQWLAPWNKKHYGFSRDGMKLRIVSWSEEEWEAWARAVKEKAGRQSMYMPLSRKELITGIILLVAAILIVYLWR